MTRLIGAVSLGWAGVALPQLFDELAAMGGQCLELNSTPGLHAGLTLDGPACRQVRQWAASAGIRISGVSGYNDFAQDDPQAVTAEVERLLQACRVAAELGAGIVRAFPGDARPGVALDDVWPAIVEGFRRAARLAEPLGVILAIENHGLLLNDGALLARLVREIGAPGVGLTLDTGNFCWAGHDLALAEADFAAALPHAVNVHIKDGVWEKERFEFVPAGQGELPLAGWLGRLAARGYEGAICSEFEGSGPFLEGTRQSIAYLRGLNLSPAAREALR